MQEAIKRTIEFLSEDDLNCLGDVFARLKGMPPQLARVRYRADHPQWMDTLDKLEQVHHFIHCDDKREFYKLSPYALPLIHSARAEYIIKLMREAYSVFKNMYHAEPGARTLSQQIVEKLKEHPREDIIEALYYMVQCHDVWTSKSNGFPMEPNSSIHINEKVLKNSDFLDVLIDYHQWHFSDKKKITPPMEIIRSQANQSSSSKRSETDNPDFSLFEDEYTDLVNDVVNASYSTYEGRLKYFFSFIDNDSVSKNIVKSLEDKVDFVSWYEKSKKTMTGMVGSGTLDWSENKPERLGQLASLFRYFSTDRDSFITFSSTFAYAGSRFDDMVREINSQYFEPFSRDLLKYLRKSYDQENLVPASDRLVRLDHNAPVYISATVELERIKRYAIESNELGAKSPDERDLIVAELNAGTLLLQGTIVHAEKAWDLIKSALLLLKEKTKDAVLGISIIALLKTLAAILGINIPSL